MDSLPEELLTRVFDFLSCDRPHVDIANSRLVSRRFHALSSPFLVTTVVIAHRYNTLQKLREVLDHPYFSKHVTRLVWDASCYEVTVAERLSEYELQCEQNPWQSSAINKYEASLQEAHATKLALLQSAVSQSELAREREYFTRFLDDDEQNTDVCDRPMTTENILRRGHDDYHRRYHAQLEIEQRRLCLRYLHSAFEKLPKLRYFEFSDFRALSRNGENLGELCERLFGETLSPDVLPDDEQGIQELEPWNNLNSCLRNLVKINPQLKSMSFGRSQHSAWDTLQWNESPRVILPDMHPDDEEQWRSLLGSVRHLSLPVEINDSGRILESAVSNTQRLLSYSASSLTHLMLETELYSGLWRPYWDCMSTTAPVLASILGQIHFQSLTSIVLRGWLIPLRDLEDLLLAHATTLRNMHLINCCIEGASKDELMVSIRSKLEPALALTGVEVFGLMYEASCDAGLTRAQVMADCHDIEELFLGGRRNMVTKVERLCSDEICRDMWWDMEIER